ncbi:hypothetical protein DFH06DRAFT_559152 [Mycena polygramma]|nr:hypothetical protein DFH06DRAFT_559152 [Mycena polygramma]
MRFAPDWWMDVLLYGVSVVLFLVSVHLLYHRRTPSRATFLVLTAAMAFLATVQFSLHIVTTSLALRLLRMVIVNGQRTVPITPVGLEALYWKVVFTEDVVLVTNTVITDGLLVYRCYLVWGRPHRGFLVLPILLMLGTLATGYVTTYDEDYSDAPLSQYHFDPRIVFVLNGFMNFVVMLLTAGRISWATRQQRAVLGPTWAPQYDAAIAIVLESGAIYCCGLVFQIVALSVQNSSPTAVYLSHGTIGQLVNITSTLIVVRVGLGHTMPTTTSSAHTNPNSHPGLRVNIPRPLHFASDVVSRSDVGFGASEPDIELEETHRK